MMFLFVLHVHTVNTSFLQQYTLNQILTKCLNAVALPIRINI